MKAILQSQRDSLGDAIMEWGYHYKLVVLAIFVPAMLLPVSCKSEPLPQQPGTNAITVCTMPAVNNAQTVAIDALMPAQTNNWQNSTNWQPIARIPVVAGQTIYSSTNALAPSSMVIAWATNSAGNSPWAGPVTYLPDPIKTTQAALNVQ